MIDMKDDLITESLQRVAKGSIIIFLGTVIGMILSFSGKIIFARYFSPEEYGVFNLGITVLSLSMIFGTLGLSNGITRQIAYFYGKNEKIKIKFIINSGLLFGVLAGIIISIILFFSSNIIANVIFKSPDLSITLKIFSIAITFYIMINLLTSTFRGFKKAKERVIFNDFMRNFIFIIILLLVVFFNLPYIYGIISFAIAIIVTSILFLVYSTKKGIISFKYFINFKWPIGKKLLLFSLPLLIVAVMYQILNWTDTFVLGLLKNPYTVGIYNSACPIGHIISTGIGVIGFMYAPIASEFFGMGKINEIRKSYAILTKWLFSITLPIAFIVILFPEFVLNILFGNNYIIASLALQILVIGYLFDSLTGPDGTVLTALGETKYMMKTTTIAAILNIILNVILISKFSIEGAALATIIAAISANILRMYKLNKTYKINPFKKDLLKPLVISIMLLFFIYILIENFIIVQFWHIPIIFFIFTGFYLLFMFLTKSITNEDLKILKIILKNKK